MISRWPVALLLTALLTACGEQQKVTQPEVPEPGEEMPADLKSGDTFAREGHDILDLPGVCITAVIRSDTERANGAYLEAGDVLLAKFQEDARSQLPALTFRGRLLTAYMAEDAKVRELWEAALERVRVTRSRPFENGEFDVVLQADLVPIYTHMK